MNQLKWGLFAVVGVYAGCSGKLSVDSDSSTAGSAGLGGVGAVAGQGVAGLGVGAVAGQGAVAGLGAGAVAGLGAGAVAGQGAGGSGATGGFGAGGDGVGEAGFGNYPAGSLGGPCYAGGTQLEQAGSPVQAQVTMLDRCDGGLACDVGTCVVAPACPASIGGTCRVHSASSAMDQQLSGGIAATATQLYWVEYGTRDALGNHLHNGSLKAYDLGTGLTSTVSASFAGPISLWLSSTHAYVTVDGGPLVGSARHFSLVRVPLGGGPIELVEDNLFPCETCLTSANGTAYWLSGSEIHSIAPATTGAAWSSFLVLPSYVSGLSVSDDGLTLYYTDYSSIWSTVLSTHAQATAASWTPVQAFTPQAGSLYGLEDINGGDGTMLDRVASNGAWERLRPLGAGIPGFSDRPLRFVGDRFFAGEQFSVNSVPRFGVVTGRLSQPAQTLVRVVYQEEFSASWAATANAVFWSDGTTIYSQAIP